MSSSSHASNCLFDGGVPVNLSVSGCGGAGSFLGKIPGQATVKHMIIQVMGPCNNNLDAYNNNNKGWHVKIFDRNDPFAFYCTHITFDEFSVLRREQNLLIDHDRFPYKLIEMLQQCRRPSATFCADLIVEMDGGSGGGGGGEGGARLIISELTSFKKINHLCLRMRRPDEAALSKHIRSIINGYKSEIASLKSQSPSSPQPNHKTIFANTNYGSQAQQQPSSPPLDTQFLQNQNQLLQAQKASAEAELERLRERYAAVQSEVDRIKHGVDGGGKSPPPRAQHRQQEHHQFEDQKDLTKANDIIRKNQTTIKNLKSQLSKLKSQVPAPEDHPKTLKAALETEKERTKQLTDQNQKLVIELEESKKLVEANEKIIEWLHHQINQDSLHRLLHPDRTASGSGSGITDLPPFNPREFYGTGTTGGGDADTSITQDSGGGSSPGNVAAATRFST